MASGKGARLTMKLEDSPIRKYLALMAKRGQDVRPYHKRLGTWMAYRSVKETFKKPGRPYKWKRLSKYTIAIRRWCADPDSKAPVHRAFTRKILVVTGGLKGSFTFVARPKRLDVGTTYENAVVHQFGKWVRAPKGWARPMVKVPKRQLIAIHPEDEQMAIKLAIRYLAKG